jgi:hypothetical protein
MRTTAAFGSFSSTVSNGSTAYASPEPIKLSMVGLSSERKTNVSETGACRKAASMICQQLTLRVPIIGRWAISAMLTARLSCLGSTLGRHEHHRVFKQQADIQSPGLVLPDLGEGDLHVAGLDGVDQISGFGLGCWPWRCACWLRWPRALPTIRQPPPSGMTPSFLTATWIRSPAASRS